MTIEIRSRSRLRTLIEACRDDFGRFAFEGFGVDLTDEQLEVADEFGTFGPRRPGEPKTTFLSGGQRSGKTVLFALKHADAGLYKRGLDRTDSLFWRNYAYGTLAIAPSDELTARLYAIMDELSKGANNAQYDDRLRHARPAAFIGKVKAGKIGRWGIVRYSNGAFTDFRSSEGRATRLEGGQWWGCTWDEWATQPDYEIEYVRTDVLLGRLRDHDAKLVCMAWPKPETEHHLIKVIRDIEKGRDLDSRVMYLSAEKAHFTNRRALAVERRQKDEAKWKRTVLGQPAGGAGIEFKHWMIENAKVDAPVRDLPHDGFIYFNAWDIGLAHDSTCGTTFAIPILPNPYIDGDVGRPTVDPLHRARVVAFDEIRGDSNQTIDTVTFRIAERQGLYHGQTALDATSMGGVATARALEGMRPPPLSFTARANDRLHGNIRLAAITNALELLTWGRQDIAEIAKHSYDLDWVPPEATEAWGLIEIPAELVDLIDNLLAFDRDAKHLHDDPAWSFMIGCWYIRRYWVRGSPTEHVPRPFNIAGGEPVAVRNRRNSILVGTTPEPVAAGVVARGRRAYGPEDVVQAALDRSRPVVRWSRPAGYGSEGR